MWTSATWELVLSGLVLGRAPRPPWWGRALRKGLAYAFWAVSRTLFDVQVRGLEHFSNAPGTIVISNHKTDFDIVLLAPTLYRAGRGRGPVVNLAFVAAERMFLPGYFATELVRWPAALSRLLFSVNLSAVLQGLRAYPIPQASRRKLSAHLREVLARAGNLPLEEVLHRPEAFFPEAPAGARIRDVLRWRYREALWQDVDFAAFRRPQEKALRQRHLEEILACLGRFAAILEEGDPLFFAPEGDLSRDGTFREVKAGLPRLLRAVSRPVRLLPVNFTYDFMTVDRVRVFLTFGPELQGAAAWSRARFEGEIKRRILSLSTVTLGQLACHRLLARAEVGQEALELASFRRELAERARALQAAGWTVDPRLLSPRSFERRWRTFLNYCEQEGLVRVEGPRLVFDPDALLDERIPAHGRVPDWRYSANEFEALREVKTC